MLTALAPDEQISTAHRAKRAYIYVRQSSVNQMKHHRESTELQYRLVDRAVRFGWPRERVEIIDEDLGKSGAGASDRSGFQKLIAEIGLGNAGLVVSLDASRLARNNRDWHQLLELCSLFRRPHRRWRTPLQSVPLSRSAAARPVRAHDILPSNSRLRLLSTIRITHKLAHASQSFGVSFTLATHILSSNCPMAASCCYRLG